MFSLEVLLNFMQALIFSVLTLMFTLIAMGTLAAYGFSRYPLQLISVAGMLASAFAFGLRAAFPAALALALRAGFLILLPPLTSDLLPSCA